mmetsp:Transcript_12604/g.18877  ORF Transcript_12604/g.18877 Transcript_12604/m.18877 type:complete len:464 (+) Transcript_12604:85-1476(+)
MSVTDSRGRGLGWGYSNTTLILILKIGFMLASFYFIAESISSYEYTSLEDVQMKTNQGDKSIGMLGANANITSTNDTTSEDPLVRLRQFVSKAKELLRSGDRDGLTPPLPQEIHYKVSKHQLSTGTSSSFQFSLYPANDTTKKTKELAENQYHEIFSSNDQVICKVHHSMMGHFPHFSQAAFPCWSILQRFPNAKRFMELENRESFKSKRWINDMLNVFESAGISIKKPGGTNTTNQYREWIAAPNNIEQPSWPIPDRKDHPTVFKVDGPSYFINQHDVMSLQQHLLQQDYIARMAGSALPLQVLLFQRKGETREWVHAQETANKIKQAWGNWIEVKVLSTLNGNSLKEQALEFHRADIIVSPHGAQLTNLAFIRPCTVVLELFPNQYYLSYFQKYVLSAAGIHYEGYELGRSPLHDTMDTINNSELRGSARGKQMLASPQSILHALPRLILSCLSCQEDDQR